MEYHYLKIFRMNILYTFHTRNVYDFRLFICRSFIDNDIFSITKNNYQNTQKIFHTLTKKLNNS